jgi:hypothetical protein
VSESQPGARHRCLSPPPVAPTVDFYALDAAVVSQQRMTGLTCPHCSHTGGRYGVRAPFAATAKLCATIAP